MRVQFGLGARTGSDQLLLGRTVLPPGARHERHSHPNCDQFRLVSAGGGRLRPPADLAWAFDPSQARAVGGL